jgi:hypothetical protein
MFPSIFSWCANSVCRGIRNWRWGAIASGGVELFNGDVVNALRIPDDVINAVSAMGISGA